MMHNQKKCLPLLRHCFTACTTWQQNFTIFVPADIIKIFNKSNTISNKTLLFYIGNIQLYWFKDIMIRSFFLSHSLWHEIVQSGCQSELERAPLMAVIAGYCHFLGQIQVRSSTEIDILKKVLYQEYFHFLYRLEHCIWEYGSINIMFMFTFEAR